MERLNIPVDPFDYALAVFAGDNGVSVEGISSYHPNSSWIIARNHISGRSFTARLMQRLGKREYLVDVALVRDLPPDSAHVIPGMKVTRGTGNILCEPALNREQVVRCLEAGESTAQILATSGMRAIGIGEIGVGNTVSAYVLAAKILQLPPESTVGWGSDPVGDRYRERLALVRGIELRIRELPLDTLQLLAEAGSAEIIAMAGAIIAANRSGMAVMLDGFVSAVAALIASRLEPGCERVLMAPTLTRENAHAPALKELRLIPLSNLGLGYGEGLAAGTGLFLLEMANSFRLRQDLEYYEEN